MMSIVNRGTVLYHHESPTEATPLIMIAHKDQNPKEVDQELGSGGGGGASDGSNDLTNRGLAAGLDRIYRRFEWFTGVLGWEPLTFTAFATLVLIFTLTSYTCVQYGPIAGLGLSSLLSSPPPSTPFQVQKPSSQLQNPKTIFKPDHCPTSTSPEIQSLWGAYSPYFDADEYKSPPRGCRINQVNIIQRHGARYPTWGADERIRGALSRLQSATSYSDPKYAFLKEYKYDLGIADLVPLGAFQSAEAGASTYERYRKLVYKGNGIPFVRASGSDRVVDSATNWTMGFADANNNIFEPKLSVIIPEYLNDTLEDAMCPSAGTPDAQTSTWTEIFATPIAAHLNAVARGASVTPGDVVALMSVCAFESVAGWKGGRGRGRGVDVGGGGGVGDGARDVGGVECGGGGGKERSDRVNRFSPFCGLFSEEEFEKYEYYSDLEKYYNRGYGQPLGRVQGVGYTNELLARLTHKPVRDNTQTNRTLDSAPETFPLDRSIYVDFSHDNLMVAVFGAMGLFRQGRRSLGLGSEVGLFGRRVGRGEDKGGHLDATKPDQGRTWVSSLLVPFSGRMVVERMECRGRGRRSWFWDDERDESDFDEEYTNKEVFVRILVNDAVQPLEFCGGDVDGLCTLERFVKSQAYARHDGYGDFEKCYES